jgi:hypothetical protein
MSWCPGAPSSIQYKWTGTPQCCSIDTNKLANTVNIPQTLVLYSIDWFWVPIFLDSYSQGMGIVGSDFKILVQNHREKCDAPGILGVLFWCCFFCHWRKLCVGFWYKRLYISMLVCIIWYIKYLICTNSICIMCIIYIYNIFKQAVKTPKTCNSYIRPMMWATRGCTECSGRRLGRPPSQRGLLLFHVNWPHFWKVNISMCIYIYMYIISKIIKVYIYIKILYNTAVWFVYIIHIYTPTFIH